MEYWKIEKSLPWVVNRGNSFKRKEEEEAVEVALKVRIQNKKGKFISRDAIALIEGKSSFVLTRRDHVRLSVRVWVNYRVGV